MSNTPSMISSTPSPLPIVANPRVAEPTGEYDNRSGGDRWVEVLLDYSQNSGLEAGNSPKLFTYRIPKDLDVNMGDIVLVPFGAQTLGGIVVRSLKVLPADLEPDRVRNVKEIIAEEVFSATYWKFLERVTEYYFAPLISVIRMALPPGLLVKPQSRIRLRADVIPKGFEVFCSTIAQDIIALLRSQKEGDYSSRHIYQKLGKSRRSLINRGLQELKKRGWIERYIEPPASVQPKMRKAVIVVPYSSVLGLSDRQREILKILQNEGGTMWLTDCVQNLKTTSQTLKRLEKSGHIIIQDREELRFHETSDQNEDRPKTLNQNQAKVLETLQNISGYARILLHGVTGSGKTEVYLQAIAPVLKQGKSVLVLVPEISLTPQLTDRFRARFSDRVRVYHSGLNQGERYDTWRFFFFQNPQVIIGTRSAVFAPLKNLGLIILDEEHDHSFKEDRRTPTYHARTVAQWRAELENCPLILGSATPALETWIASQTPHPPTPSQEGESKKGVTNNQQTTINPPPNPLPRGGEQERSNQQPTNNNQQRCDPASAKDASGQTPRRRKTQGNADQERERAPRQPITNNQQQIHYLSLPDRIHSRPFPPVEVVDMRKELKQGNRSMFSIALRDALKQLKPTRKKGILFIPRRGHSTFVSCRSCGYVIECPRCDVSLSYHHVREGAKQILRCHYCNYSIPHPSRCPECDSPYLKFFGSGTQKVAKAIAQEFSDLRVIRFDSDTTRAKGAHRTKLTEFAEGEADLLVGTQMLTKGLDIAEVTLVGILAADGLLHLADYRASERAFQTLTQVAGRAGRGDDPGRVILQTYTPDHPVIEAVCNHDYFAFARETLVERSQMNYPPYSRLILLRLSGLDAEEVESAANIVAQGCQTLLVSIKHELLGPAPASIMRIDRRYRWQILLKFSLETKNLPDLAQLKKLCPSPVRLTIDVDPLSIG